MIRLTLGHGRLLILLGLTLPLGLQFCLLLALLLLAVHLEEPNGSINVRLILDLEGLLFVQGAVLDAHLAVLVDPHAHLLSGLLGQVDPQFMDGQI